MKVVKNISKYNEFINEASVYSLRLGVCVLCTKNFRGIKYAKDKVAKIVGKRNAGAGPTFAATFKVKLKFNENLIDSRVSPDSGDEPILTDTIEITNNQIAGLVVISERDYLRYIDGFKMKILFREGLRKIILSGRFRGTFSKFYKKSYFDIIDEKTISYLSIENDHLVAENDKYTSNLRESFSVIDFFKEMYPFNGEDSIEYNLKIFDTMIGDIIRAKKGFLIYQVSALFETLMRMSTFKTKYKYNEVSYIDIIDKNTVTFLTPDLIKKINDTNIDVLYNSKLRQSTKIGRLLKKLNEDYSESEIENFGNIIKAKYEIMKTDNVVNVVTGDDITYWYNIRNYIIGNGTLQNSCMRYDRKDIIDRVSMYSKYPDKIAMAILLNKDGKLMARALIWRLDEPKDVIFMDRIYYTLPEHELIMKDYAFRNNIKTKSEGFNTKNKMKVILNEPFTKVAPYLDTFTFYNTTTLINK